MKVLAGNSQARGRNGWFVPRQISAFATHVTYNGDNPREVVVDIYSKRSGDHAPISFWLSVEDARQIIGELTSALVDAQNPAKAEVA